MSANEWGVEGIKELCSIQNLLTYMNEMPILIKAPLWAILLQGCVFQIIYWCIGGQDMGIEGYVVSF